MGVLWTTMYGRNIIKCCNKFKTQFSHVKGSPKWTTYWLMYKFWTKGSMLMKKKQKCSFRRNITWYQSVFSSMSM